jgi:hypothetical protein
VPHPKAHGIFILYGITADKAQLAISDSVKYNKNNKPQYDLILGVKTMKKYGIILDFKDKMIITVDEVNLPMETSTICRALAPSVR